jgi:transcription antitermination factor NusG
MGERENKPEAISRAVQHILGQLDVFIPAVSEKRQAEEHTVYFMEGYVFVEYRPNIQYLKLLEIPFFKSVMCHRGERSGGEPSYSLLDDKVLDPIRTGMQEMKCRALKVHDHVRVNRGTYKNMHGVVDMIGPDGVLVNAKLTSKPLKIEFPASWLDLEAKAT